MNTYRFYRLDTADHFRGVEIIEAPHDNAAIERARALFEADPSLPGFELWDQARPVARRRREAIRQRSAR